MDKIGKFLKKLSKSELAVVETTLKQLLTGDVSRLNLKKLKGHDAIFRVRVKNLRIIFHKKNEDIKVLEIARRNERTYKNY